MRVTRSVSAIVDLLDPGLNAGASVLKVAARLFPAGGQTRSIDSDRRRPGRSVRGRPPIAARLAVTIAQSENDVVTRRHGRIIR